MEISFNDINSFALGTTDPRLLALLAEICRRIEALENENERLWAELDKREIENKNLAEGIKDLKERVLELELQQDEVIEKINEHSENINTVWAISKRPAAPKGQKTKQRLEKIDHILKERGPQTLGQLEKDLGISPQEMSRLLRKLDKRRYEVHKRPGCEREKIVRLRSQIN